MLSYISIVLACIVYACFSDLDIFGPSKNKFIIVLMSSHYHFANRYFLLNKLRRTFSTSYYLLDKKK